MKKIFFITGIIFVCLLFSKYSPAEEIKQDGNLVEEEQLGGLACQIETDKEVYDVGEEIIFTLTWQNLGDKEILIYYREDQIPYQLLSFRREDGSVPQRRLLMVEQAPHHYLKIAPNDSYALRLKAKLLREDLKVSWLAKHQKRYGNLILKFEGKLLSKFPILLDRPGKFYVSFYYYLPADSFLAKKESDAWTGEVVSGEILFEVRDGEQ